MKPRPDGTASLLCKASQLLTKHQNKNNSNNKETISNKEPSQHLVTAQRAAAKENKPTSSELGAENNSNLLPLGTTRDTTHSKNKEKQTRGGGERKHQQRPSPNEKHTGRFSRKHRKEAPAKHTQLQTDTQGGRQAAPQCHLRELQWQLREE